MSLSHMPLSINLCWFLSFFFFFNSICFLNLRTRLQHFVYDRREVTRLLLELNPSDPLYDEVERERERERGFLSYPLALSLLSVFFLCYLSF